ncbi:dihydrofolate reductase family protein [Flavobacterium sp. M31R6]|uniref:dihydrofolate reductase family protein n=1 Tax=Flavobacterium sp. M31R6 TaxID=2739062 RepID=UPI001568B106|nr:dihydrofolate reductase family protein [Flavobacterium sp. M31R6]QKJ63025.1 dihydrofolate reductase [Flavobacterium sp. M31R6]
MRTTAYIGTSLDGFIARKNGEIDWLIPFDNQEINKSYTKFISHIDVIIIGRGTFEKVITFPSWPYQQKVFVLSTQIKEIPNNLKEKVSILSMKPKELLHYLSDEGYSNAYVDGGKVIQSFLKENLLDALIITRVPVLIGDGIPLFGQLDQDTTFKHLHTNIFSNGLVMSHYEKN